MINIESLQLRALYCAAGLIPAEGLKELASLEYKDGFHIST